MRLVQMTESKYTKAYQEGVAGPAYEIPTALEDRMAEEYPQWERQAWTLVERGGDPLIFPVLIVPDNR